ncbi:hypothetical protein FPOA_11292 [Fusarium poae]|uniref:Uncharacterized protein n=1 Tax=Fusarium poae TaxID=36050 RepID=A0A1B8AGM1_FUSPO|nr:hypothetical protein FPOA_11292 [Fusarium poae]
MCTYHIRHFYINPYLSYSEPHCLFEYQPTSPLALSTPPTYVPRRDIFVAFATELAIPGSEASRPRLCYPKQTEKAIAIAVLESLLKSPENSTGPPAIT